MKRPSNPAALLRLRALMAEMICRIEFIVHFRIPIRFTDPQLLHYLFSNDDACSQPIGANSLAICVRSCRFISLSLRSGLKFSLNVNVSLTGCHRSPSFLIFYAVLISRGNWTFGSHAEIVSRIALLFGFHLRSLKPLFLRTIMRSYCN